MEELKKNNMGNKYTKKEIMEMVGKEVLGMPRPDELMLKKQSNFVGEIQGKYVIFDFLKKTLK